MLIKEIGLEDKENVNPAEKKEENKPFEEEKSEEK
jgi:hypothetical protein